MCDLLFQAASTAIRQQAEKELNGQVGVIAVLHTWGQQLFRHVHGVMRSDHEIPLPLTPKHLMPFGTLSSRLGGVFRGPLAF